MADSALGDTVDNRVSSDWVVSPRVHIQPVPDAEEGPAHPPFRNTPSAPSASGAIRAPLLGVSQVPIRRDSPTATRHCPIPSRNLPPVPGPAPTPFEPLREIGVKRVCPHFPQFPHSCRHAGGASVAGCQQLWIALWITWKLPANWASVSRQTLSPDPLRRHCTPQIAGDLHATLCGKRCEARIEWRRVSSVPDCPGAIRAGAFR